MWWETLEDRGAESALGGNCPSYSYRELALAADELAKYWPQERQVVHIRAAKTAATIVAYVATLRHNHVPLLTGEDDASAAELIKTYPAGIAVDATADVPVSQNLSRTSVLHPDLGLLASTSGSTGSAKLVRISQTSVDHNARAIAESLDLTSASVGITSLPLHYCYGMSVVASHLAVGGRIVLSDHSVATAEFWQDVNTHHVTQLAGVPHTYRLLEHHHHELQVSSIRQLTQAGGPLPSTQRQQWVDFAERHDLDFRVMYGQTEATARITCQQAGDYDDITSVGRPLADTHVRIDPETKTLHVSGPGIMMGYATSVGDLALGRCVESLDTGDHGHIDAEGKVTIKGRQSRMAKIVGKRIDLDQLETLLASDTMNCAIAAADGGPDREVGSEPWINIAWQSDATADECLDRGRTIARQLGLPATAVNLQPVLEIPTLHNSKTDYRSIAAWPKAANDAADDATLDSETGHDSKKTAPLAALQRVYRNALGLSRVEPTDSFVSLNGDSLSYVSASVGVERTLRKLPAGWTEQTLEELAAQAPASATSWTERIRQLPKQLFATVETATVFRCVAILLIMLGHTGLHDTQGSAHALLVLVGMNLFRFQLQKPDPRRALLKTVGLVVGISLPVYILLFSFNEEYSWHLLTYSRMTLGDEFFDHDCGYWFIEVLVWTTLGIAALYAVPQVRSLIDRAPWIWWMSVTGVGLAARFGVFGPEMGWNGAGRPLFAFWLITAGIAIAASRNMVQSGLACLAVAVGLAGFFRDEALREILCLVFVLVLAWVPRIPLPRLVVPVIELISSATLFIYLVHWEIIRPLDEVLKPGPFGQDMVYVALPVAVVAGLLYHWVWTRLAIGASLWSQARKRAFCEHLDDAIDWSQEIAQPIDRHVPSYPRQGGVLPVRSAAGR